jgi:hypothetical protein
MAQASPGSSHAVAQSAINSAMRLAPTASSDADGLYLVTRGPQVEEGGDMRDGPIGADPLDPLGRPESALELPGCPTCQALPHLDTELVGWFVTQSLADGDGRQRLYAAGGLCGRHWRAVADEELRRRRGLLGTAQVLAEVLARRSARGQVPVACPICEDLEVSAANRLYLLLTKLGPAALTQAPPSWRPCLPHLDTLRRLRLERWLGRWVEQQAERVVPEVIKAAHRYARTREQRYHHEASGSEAQDLLDAIATLTGPTNP